MPAAIKSLPNTSLVAQVRDQIQRAIMQGEIPWGRRINEADIALRLGVSRGPVREAARLLQQQGLLVSHPRRGFFVREFSKKEIDDLYELREWLEVAAVQAAVERATPSDLRELRNLHADLKDAAAHHAPHDIVERIVSFHRMICSISGNRRLLRLFEEIAVELRFLLSVLRIGEDTPPNAIELDSTLLDVIDARDSQAAKCEMLRYIRTARQEVLDHYATLLSRGDIEPV